MSEATARAVGLQRLYQQRLSANPFATPEEVVGWLGAVQAQDYPGAKWALALRMAKATENSVEQAFDAGKILRTHLMRPTWHFVTPADIRWLLDLTAPHVNAINGYMYRQQKLDEPLLARTNDIIAAALTGGKQLTREELAIALRQAGVEADGVRLGYIVHRAELDKVVCSGARRGKQFTYALLDERAPVEQARILSRAEALAELSLRFYTAHGPATVRDFIWWSGLSIADAKAGLEMVASQLESIEHNGQIYWFSAQQPPVAQPCETAFLLPTYDEFLLGYETHDRARLAGLKEGEIVAFDSMIIIGGRIVGSWRRTLKKDAVVIELKPLISLTNEQIEAINAATERFGQFLGLSVVRVWQLTN
jgi:hypothetical protein